MPYSVAWDTKVVSIQISDLILVSGAEYNLDLELCHEELRRLEYDFYEGAFAEQILEYTLPKTISGTTLAGVVEIINGYTFVFPVAAAAVNLVGANTNLGELSITPANGVSIRPQNSAGNTITTISTGSGLDATQNAKLMGLPDFVSGADKAEIANDVNVILADDFDAIPDAVLDKLA